MYTSPMFGLLRLLLSILVAASHITGPIKLAFLTPLSSDFNQGSFAVIGFYILSGYLMTAVLKNKFTHQYRLQIKQFFQDRFLRIFPLYYFYLLLTIFFLLITNRFIFSLTGFFSHLTIFPLNYYQLVRINLETFTINPLITPAWSLASELHFYLLIPFIINKPKVKLFFFFSSLSIFISSSLFLTEPFFFNYVFPLGTLFAFLTGSYLFEHKSGASAKPVYATWLTILTTFIYLIITDKTQNGVNAEIFLGFIILVPIISILSNYQDSSYSKILGNLAYPIFLSHSLAGRFPSNSIYAYLLSLALSILGYLLIESPFTKLRRYLKNNTNQKKLTPKRI